MFVWYYMFFVLFRFIICRACCKLGYICTLHCFQPICRAFSWLLLLLLIDKITLLYERPPLFDQIRSVSFRLRLFQLLFFFFFGALLFGFWFLVWCHFCARDIFWLVTFYFISFSFSNVFSFSSVFCMPNQLAIVIAVAVAVAILSAFWIYLHHIHITFDILFLFYSQNHFTSVLRLALSTLKLFVCMTNLIWAN
jgi:hypothetical protein